MKPILILLWPRFLFVDDPPSSGIYNFVPC